MEKVTHDLGSRLQCFLTFLVRRSEISFIIWGKWLFLSSKIHKYIVIQFNKLMDSLQASLCAFSLQRLL